MVEKIVRSEDKNESGSAVKQALREIRRLRDRLERYEARSSEPIAIVGMGCRFPGGIENPRDYWRLLESGESVITEIPADRWDANAFYDSEAGTPGKMSTRWGGFLAGIDCFDAEFFGLSAREACGIDPQQRLLLESAWAALEDAGVPADGLQGSATGVFAGIGTFDYAQLELSTLATTEIDAYFATGASHSVAAGRVSYYLGLNGPCLALDTACSSSLVAVHLACQSLRAGECRLALAGGVSVLLLPEMFIDFSHAQMMAADGRCKPFDARADGYVRSEGCGMIALKRLSDAIEDGDRLLAVVAGSAVNHDGRSSGLTAPNGPAQTAVIRTALSEAGIEPGAVGYVEAHGTGTSLGDPIELQALGQALGGDSRTQAFVVGSVKSNLGHCEAAAGIAGLIKSVLCIQHGVIPATLNFTEPNPKIPWDRLPLSVATENMQWSVEEGERIAGVSSFGFSGTNAHVILRQAPEVARTLSEWVRPTHLMTASARTASALRSMCLDRAGALRDESAPNVADAAFTANTGRATFEHRIAVVGRTNEELASALASYESGEAGAGTNSGAGEPEICFLYPGQGSQYSGMGRALFDCSPVFRNALQDCDSRLAPRLGVSLVDAIYAKPNAALERIPVAQSAIVAVEYALTKTLASWNVHPAAVLGHSLGEYTAAIVAGVVSLDDGLALVAERARLIEELCADAAMFAVRADRASLEELIRSGEHPAWIAALNGPASNVISVVPDEASRLTRDLAARSIQYRQIQSSRGFHSELVEAALEPFSKFAAGVAHTRPRIAFASTLEGGWMESGPTEAHWPEHARRPVQFESALRAVTERGFAACLEVGPSSTLSVMAREIDEGGAGVWLHSLTRDSDELGSVLSILGSLYCRGIGVDWAAFDAPYKRERVELPGYPFERRRYWFGANGTRQSASSQRTGAASVVKSGDGRSVWQHCIDAAGRQADMAPLGLDFANYAGRWQLLESLTLAHSLRTIRDLGGLRDDSEPTTAADLVAANGIAAMYAPLLDRWLARLAASGRVLRHGEGYCADEAEADASVELLESQARDAFSDAPYIVEYLSRCGSMLTDVIRGDVSALETLFPNGSTQTAIDLYRTWHVARYFNQIVAAAAGAVARAVGSDRVVQLLEIGAGTGSTTASVLPELDPARTRYWFTDVSEFFFSGARREFSDFEFLEFGLLDAGKNPTDQGFGRHAFDAVLAANVLHATPDLAATIDNVLSLLRPGGSLILYEVTDPPAWLDTSVALIEGWARSDDGLRDDGPLLAASTWSELLSSRGFSAVEVFPGPDSPARIIGFSVILARSPASDSASDELPPGPAGLSSAKFAARPEAVGAAEFLGQLDEAVGDERIDVLIDFVREHVAAVLRRDPADEPIGRRRNLMEIGVDSLMAIELRDRLTVGAGLEKRLSSTLIFDYPNIEAIARHLDGQIDKSGNGETTSESSRAVAERSVEDLGDDEIEALLRKKLDGS
jgi:acyl transferase domain-containing protein/predicted O-methyltransferase YrrM